MRYLGCAFCALVLSAMVASPAWAAFPGRNGLLAVQPVIGGGVLLVNTDGRAERRICSDASLCGSPQDPRWSPDGQALAFTGTKVQLVYPDGSCLDCQMGSAGTPAFTANPTLVTFESDGALVEDGIDDIRKATIVKGRFSDAVWSARGELAVVRGGSVWAGSPHKLRRIAAGGAPSWSPSGSQLALARKGWIVVVGLRHRSVRRLVRGTAPAFSPNGKSIAFIAPGHRLSIVPAAGGAAARPVGSVRGASVDWQPLPRKAPGCLAPPGSGVLASSTSAVLTSDSNSTSSAALGCLRATGRERFLELVRSTVGVGVEQLTGPGAVGDGYAALVLDSDDSHYSNLDESVLVFNLSTGAQPQGMGGESAGCSGELGSGDSCSSSGINQVAVGQDGISAADTVSYAPPGSNSNSLDAVSCPSPSLCLAADGLGHAFTTTDPTAAGGGWTETNVPWVGTVSCPSVSLCVGATQAIPAAGGPVSTIYTSTDPTGGASAWIAGYTAAGADGGFSAVSCPSVSLCVATDDSGDVVTSTDPTGGATAWTAAKVDGYALAGISCPSVSLCVATDADGHVITSTNPTGGAGAWQTVNATATGSLGPENVSCPSTTLCVGAGPGGPVWTSTNPTANASWTNSGGGVNVTAVDCPSTSLCLAVGGEGNLMESTSPTSGPWTYQEIDYAHDLLSISCASSTLCVAGDSVGNLTSLTSATGGEFNWSSALVDGDPCSAVFSCRTENIIAVDTTGYHSLDTTSEPSSGPPLLTSLSLSGDTLTWDHAGTSENAALHP